jgi:nucleotide-binding universal stress UspA family protein
MYERILLAVDDTPSSRRAVTAAAGLAASVRAEIVVLELPTDGMPADLARGTVGGEPSLADQVVMDLKDRGLSARPELWEASAEDLLGSLAGIAMQEGADLVVLGDRGSPAMGPGGETLADRLRGLTRLPVLLVP